MPGILCQGEIAVKQPERHKERENFQLWHLAAALCFRLEWDVWEGNKYIKKKEERTESAISTQCPVFQAHPTLTLHPQCLLVLFPSSSKSFTLQPQTHSRGEAWLHSLSADSLTSNVSTKVPQSLFTRLERYESHSIKNSSLQQERLYLVRIVIWSIVVLSFLVWMLHESFKSSSFGTASWERSKFTDTPGPDETTT